MTIYLIGNLYLYLKLNILGSCACNKDQCHVAHQLKKYLCIAYNVVIRIGDMISNMTIDNPPRFELDH